MAFRILVLSLVVAAGAVWAQQAQAQAYGGFYTGSSDNPVGPTVSPYINLLGSNGAFGATNYQALVRPLIEQHNAINRQGAAINRLQQQQPYGGAAGGATGHGSFFMNGMHFYPQGLR